MLLNGHLITLKYGFSLEMPFPKIYRKEFRIQFYGPHRKHSSKGRQPVILIRILPIRVLFLTQLFVVPGRVQHGGTMEGFAAVTILFPVSSLLPKTPVLLWMR